MFVHAGGGGDGYRTGTGLNDAGGTGGTSYYNKNRIHLIAFSSKPIESGGYSFASQISQTGSQQKTELNLDQYDGFVVIYEQIDYCCQGAYPCVVVNSDELENANVLCACTFSSFQPGSCPSIGEFQIALIQNVRIWLESLALFLSLSLSLSLIR